jgi:hypothetical protein
MYSAMASVSQTAKPSSSTSTGTLPAGVTRAKAEPGLKSKRSVRSMKGMWSCVRSTQGRIDQDEVVLVADYQLHRRSLQ